MSFLNSSGKPESWKYQGGSWTEANFIKEADGGNKILTWITDAATTRKQVAANERKAGMQISYLNPDKGWINEQYVGTDTQDFYWGQDDYWDTVVNTIYMSNSMYIPLDWNVGVRQTRIQVPKRLRKQGIKLYYKKLIVR